MHAILLKLFHSFATKLTIAIWIIMQLAIQEKINIIVTAQIHLLELTYTYLHKGLNMTVAQQKN